MKLDVYVHDRLVGELEQTDVTRFVFTYAPGTPEDMAVSLTMPVRAESWVHRSLHPVFQVSLPEGALRQMLHRRFAKHAKHFGDVELLSVIGSHLVGRVKVAPHGAKLVPDGPEESIRQLLSESSGELVDHYIGEHLQYSGVSGGFPKFLARSPVDEDGAKSTLTFDHWIVKLNDQDHPELVLNEYFGLDLAKRMGLPTPEYLLSDDCERIAIRRFDFDDKGSHLGFEDMCALMGYDSSAKFSGSVERVLKTIQAFCDIKNGAKAREQFYAQYVACMAIRNGDAHLKNFGLLYSSLSDARLAPAYDMVSMSVYAPHAQNGDALDEASMTFGGTNRWFNSKDLAKFGQAAMLSAAQIRSASERLVQAMSETSQGIFEASHDRPAFRPVAKRMLEIWSHGIEIHSETLARDIAKMAAQVDTDEPAYHKRERVRM
jgi:serine/threonine-protein kinase HipA